jgi:hypothetical protein
MTCKTCSSVLLPIIGQFSLCPKCDKQPLRSKTEPANQDDEFDFWFDEPTNPGSPVHQLYACQACGTPGMYDVNDVADGATCRMTYALGTCGGMLRVKT